MAVDKSISYFNLFTDGIVKCDSIGQPWLEYIIVESIAITKVHIGQGRAGGKYLDNIAICVICFYLEYEGNR